MAKQIDRIGSMELRPSKDGFDLQTVSVGFTLVDDEGYRKYVSKSFLLKNLKSGQQDAFLEFWKEVKNMVETEENLVAKPDPKIDTSPITVFGINVENLVKP